MDPTKKVAPCGMVVMVPMVNGLLTRTLLISTRPRRGMDAPVIRFWQMHVCLVRYFCVRLHWFEQMLPSRRLTDRQEERQTYIPT